MPRPQLSRLCTLPSSPSARPCTDFSSVWCKSPMLLPFFLGAPPPPQPGAPGAPIVDGYRAERRCGRVLVSQHQHRFGRLATLTSLAAPARIPRRLPSRCRNVPNPNVLIIPYPDPSALDKYGLCYCRSAVRTRGSAIYWPAVSRSPECVARASRNARPQRLLHPPTTSNNRAGFMLAG